jgi:PadR family transcriptional regulator, regulatory protein PadR
MPRITLQVRLVLELLLADPGRERFGLEIVDGTGLPPGTIYPILARLEHLGWFESRWEEIDPHEAGRPRRRFYRLTATGAAEAGAAVARATARRGRPSPAPAPRALPGGAF